MSQEMHTFLISLGSNYGDRKGFLDMALDWLKKESCAMRDSGIYETDSISGDGRKYMNCVAECRINCTVSVIAEEGKRLERLSGRDNKSRASGVVPLDFDVVACDNEILRQKDYNYPYFQKGLALLNSKL